LGERPGGEKGKNSGGPLPLKKNNNKMPNASNAHIHALRVEMCVAHMTKSVSVSGLSTTCVTTPDTSICYLFPSRRRHTRFKCDWSSDVCSSDLHTHTHAHTHTHTHTHARTQTRT